MRRLIRGMIKDKKGTTEKIEPWGCPTIAIFRDCVIVTPLFSTTDFLKTELSDSPPSPISQKMDRKFKITMLLKRAGLKWMGIVLVIVLLLVMQFFIGQVAVYAETIYTKDGQVIEGKIIEITADTIWYEKTEGDITEYTGIDKSDIEKITNDDGSAYSYSSASKKEE